MVASKDHRSFLIIDPGSTQEEFDRKILLAIGEQSVRLGCGLTAWVGPRLAWARRMASLVERGLVIVESGGSFDLNVGLTANGIALLPPEMQAMLRLQA